MESFDYVIVGAGSAGSVLANRLSEDEKTTVCVLEAGPRDWHPFIHIPAGFMYTLVNPRVNWLYTSEASEWTGGRRIAAPRGKTLGGSSSINGHIYNRGQRLDFDGWAQRGNHGWGYADVLPYFRRTERRMGGDDLFRGRDGQLPITDLDWRDPLCDAFIEGAVQMGIPRNRDYNGTMQAGVSYVQRVIQNGRRKSAARGYLHPAMSRKNLTVRTHAHATRIVLDGKRAVGIRYRKGGRDGATMEVRTAKEVILCGGTVNSPQLLQVSGIGPAPLLQSLGIAVKHALAGVGENLRDHYAPRTRWAVGAKGITYNDRGRGLGLVRQALHYAISGKGLLAMVGAPIRAFVRSREGLDAPDLLLGWVPMLTEPGPRGPRIARQSGMTCYAHPMRPESRGRIHIVSSDPGKPPAINFNFLSSPVDAELTVRAIRIACSIMRAPALAPMQISEIAPGPDRRSDDEILDWVKKAAETTYHPVGTCKMGSDAQAVVDARLRVHGIAGLRVADASIMPTLTSGNTNAPSIMIGEKAAAMVLEDAA